MMPCLTVCLVFIIWILNGVIHKQFAYGGEVNSSQDDDHWQKLPLTLAWIFKPPYASPPSNESLDNEAQGLMRDAVLKHIEVECSDYMEKHFDIRTLEMENEFEMLELLRQNKVHIALPIFEPPSNRRYPEFPFFKLDDPRRANYAASKEIFALHNAVVPVGSSEYVLITLKSFYRFNRVNYVCHKYHERL